MSEKFTDLRSLANPTSVLHLAPSDELKGTLESVCMSIKGKVAIVVGGGRGIGRAIAHQLAKAGAKVCVTSRNEFEVKRTAEECIAFGAEGAIGIAADARDQAAVDAVVETCVKELGEPFILVCSQGRVKVRPTEEIPNDEWQDFFATNVDSVLYYIQAAGKYMINREPIGRVRGKIIIITSITGLRGGRGVGLLAYHATKGAVCSMVRALGQEWAKYDITVNGIAPGTYLTDLSSWTGTPEKEKKYLEGHIPMKHFQQIENVIVPETSPELIGTMALYLASPASDYTTSQVIALDGGTVEHFI